MATADARSPGLASGSIGLKEVVFQSIASMGPAASLVSSLPLVMAYAGGAAVTACIIAALVMVMVAVSVSQLAQHMPSAGSFATWASAGIGPGAGFVVGWIYLILTLLIAPLLTLILASLMSAATHTESLWWLWALGTLVIVVSVNIRGVQSSSKLNVIMGLVEMAVFAVMSVILIIKAGSNNTGAVFGTSLATVPDHLGISGIIAGAAYCVLAFSGFEASAPLAEETRDPKRLIPKAVLYSLLSVVVLEIVGVYAVTVAFGPERAFDFSQIGGSLGQGWQNLANTVVPFGAALIVFAVLNSCVANANAGVNSSTRTLFALGRVEVLPQGLSRVDSRFRAPVVAIAVQTVVAVVVTFGLGIAYGPATAFAIVGTGITLLYVLLYVSVHVSCLTYFRRNRSTAHSALKHVLIPAVGLIALLPGLAVASGIKVFSFITPIAAPASYGAIACLIAIAIGIVYYVVLKRSHPERVSSMTIGIEEATV
jgi:amino acid transporter